MLIFKCRGSAAGLCKCDSHVVNLKTPWLLPAGVLPQSSRKVRRLFSPKAYADPNITFGALRRTLWWFGPTAEEGAHAASSANFLTAWSSASRVTSSIDRLTSTLMTSLSSFVGGSRISNWLRTIVAPM